MLRQSRISIDNVSLERAVLKTDNFYFYDKNCCVYRLTNILLYKTDKFGL